MNDYLMRCQIFLARLLKPYGNRTRESDIKVIPACFSGLVSRQIPIYPEGFRVPALP